MPGIRPRVFGNVSPVEVTSPLDDLTPSLPSPDFRDEMPVLNPTPIDQVEAEVYTSVTVRVPQRVYDEYRRVAAAQEQEIEEVMSHRLVSCRSHNAIRGLWFGDSDRSSLEDLLQKRPLESALQALSVLRTGGAFKLEVAENETLNIELTPAQRKVLKLAMYGGRTPKKFFEDMIRRELRV